MELKLHSKYPQNEKLKHYNTDIQKCSLISPLQIWRQHKPHSKILKELFDAVEGTLLWFGRNFLMIWKELFDDLEGTIWCFERNSLMLWKELFDALEGTLWWFGRNSGDLEGTLWCFRRNSLMFWKELFDALEGCPTPLVAPDVLLWFTIWWYVMK